MYREGLRHFVALVQPCIFHWATPNANDYATSWLELKSLIRYWFYPMLMIASVNWASPNVMITSLRGFKKIKKK